MFTLGYFCERLQDYLKSTRHYLELTFFFSKMNAGRFAPSFLGNFTSFSISVLLTLFILGY